jgi:hypothetical protein
MEYELHFLELKVSHCKRGLKKLTRFPAFFGLFLGTLEIRILRTGWKSLLVVNNENRLTLEWESSTLDF